MKDLFADESFEIIHRYAGGVPRLINTLCDTAQCCARSRIRDPSLIETDDIMRGRSKNWAGKSTRATRACMRNLQQISRAAQPCRCTRNENRSPVPMATGSSDEHAFPYAVALSSAGQPDNEIYIKSKFVSRHHAQIVS